LEKRGGTVRAEINIAASAFPPKIIAIEMHFINADQYNEISFLFFFPGFFFSFSEIFFSLHPFAGSPSQNLSY